MTIADPLRPGRTPKGRREADRILNAAAVALARDGLAATTLATIALEAGVDKRMVVYYFGSRDALIAEVVQHLAERVAAVTERAFTEAMQPPTQAAAAGLGAVWNTSLEDPVLPRAYLALLHSTQEPQARAALRSITEDFYRIFNERINALEASGYRLLDDRDGFVRLSYAVIRGLFTEWVEVGDSAALQSALAQFKAFFASRFATEDLKM